MKSIKFRNVEVKDLDLAAKCVKRFVAEFSDREGVYHGVGYSVAGADFYVYGLKTMVVCVGQKENLGWRIRLAR